LDTHSEIATRLLTTILAIPVVSHGKGTAVSSVLRSMRNMDVHKNEVRDILLELQHWIDSDDFQLNFFLVVDIMFELQVFTFEYDRPTDRLTDT
jgi:uncharacterized membrane protein